ncbi:minor capsid protein [Natribacillus halophilus]|uniref:Phage putative head morphogenesis protein, SPP1 gp7 family n=1 Tax=Natribacillus halophilus TaxID=549003 RepID=A0A1G8RSY0_9BACI|nr:minor capsid protein [Natribacillus halophilus]SDJ20029.1 phage putative head morphogenesis protein, SPP1 gp7 family [Natribacillus halophilus]
MATSRNYWARRERDQSEMERERDDEIVAIISAHYGEAADEADKEITRIYQRYAGQEGMSLADAQKQVQSTDIRDLEEKAERYVQSRDFSPQANSEMRKYNARMRASRLELMQMYADLEVSRANGLSEIEVEERLEEIARSEVRRQSGILGETVRLTSDQMEDIVRYRFHGEYFSDRIWQNKDIMIDNLNRNLRRDITRGIGPVEMARNMRNEIGGSVYNTERIMRTESGRVQINAQHHSYGQAGITHYDIVSELDACDECAAHDGEVYEVRNMQIGYNAPVFHPNCRCSTAPIVPD